ncbi:MULTISPECIES: FxsA family membrane protein [Streptomyces]|uniref:FxsA family protein n=1 Tax=Streptomyces tricolor TaxID=68277 RepID=A0ABS9JQH5_9ACTN|nr:MULTISPECIES: FxsA family membrane protein [Streptomyces]MCG0067828.1 FxsA family protein [Streptomyces tricolor]MYU28242.1 FxsA family protein [Streptomyces sp. SID7810]BCM71510.1 putative membrane protein [Streptomyces sp. EAS-AB2608]CUW27121.1 phage T7 F exclusion suppressor FxsA [Streptomyces reticuli]
MTTGAPTSPYTARRRRSRLRRYLPPALAAWLVLEIWLLTLVAGAAGGLTVFLLLVAGVVAGSVVIKRAGRRAFQSLNEALRQGGSPARGGGNGLMMLGGLLLMIPGLVSDAAGLLLLLPPVQKAVSRFAENALERSLRKAAPGSLGDAFQQARMHRPDGKVVQGEVIRNGEPYGAPQEPRPPLTR